ATPPPLHTLAIYDDAPVFGGHEQMSCCGIEALARAPHLHLVCYYHRHNHKLRKRLERIAIEHPNVRLIPLRHQSKKFQGLRSRFSGGRVRRLANQFRSDCIRAVLVLQGDIELSSLGVLAANNLGIPAISYIPVPHTLATMQAKLGSLRDPFNKWLFKRPDSFITISEGMAEMLRARGADQSITVVHNGFDASKTELRDPIEARRRLGLPEVHKLVAMVGRIEFKQKRQDFLIDCVARNFSRMENVHLVFVGSGPDSTTLKDKVNGYGLGDSATFIEWTDGLSDVYSAIDLLCLPSRFEGVPLVMLEAMSVKVPIVASARDGMKEFLPEEWLFTPDDETECVDRILTTLAAPNPVLIQKNQDLALTRFSMQTFNREFVDATCRLAGFAA
ncbi:MAG: glycosyltransferase family 4 protein, partial [Limisphaerales bacterium]